MKYPQSLNSGQTLVTLLVFSVMAIATASATAAVMISTSRSAGMNAAKVDTVNLTESGIENALMRLIRNPDYAGETLVIDGATVTTTVTGTTTKLITSTATQGVYRHQIQVVASYVDNRLTVTSWNAVY